MKFEERCLASYRAVNLSCRFYIAIGGQKTMNSDV